MSIDAGITRTGAPAERNCFRGYSAPPERILSSVRNFYKHFVPTGRNLTPLFTRSNWRRHTQLVTVLLCGIALKYFYSTASVNELRWILAPTTFLVQLITGARFQFESHAGYMNSDHTFLIAASCAGVNFLLTAFLMLTLGSLWRNRSSKIGWTFIPVAALVAYAATLVANTVRISTALRLHRLPPEISWLAPDQLHRFEGIFIYFGFLLLLFVASEWFGYRTNDIKAGSGSAPNSFGLLWRVLFPLVIYYATTLGIPLVNGAYRQGAEFLEHSLFVVLTPLIIVFPFVTFKLFKKLSVATRSTEISLRESVGKSAISLR